MARAGHQKVVDESLPATAPSAHVGFSKSRPCLHLMIMIIFKHLSTIFHGEAMAQWEIRALLT